MGTATTSGAELAWQEQTVTVCGRPLHVAVAGSGPPLVVFPRDQGHPPQTPRFMRELSLGHTVYFPWLAGFSGGEPAQWDWLTNVRDLAVVHRQMLDALGLERPALAGLGFGGWLAAEIATMAPAGIRALLLVSPMGLKPAAGYIFDQFLVSTEHYAQAAFSRREVFEELYGPEPGYEQLEAWETDREMVSRVAWKPYMYNPVLPQLLAGVQAPALIVQGEDDRIVPAECARAYRDALPKASLELVPGCGHAVEFEQPAALARLAASFLG